MCHKLRENISNYTNARIHHRTSCAVNWHLRTIVRMEGSSSSSHHISFFFLSSLLSDVYEALCGLRCSLLLFEDGEVKMITKIHLQMPCLIVAGKSETLVRSEGSKIINLTTTSYKLWLRCHTKRGELQALPENKSSSIIHFHCAPHRFIYGGKFGTATEKTEAEQMKREQFG